jgi:hypothetical protein
VQETQEGISVLYHLQDDIMLPAMAACWKVD